LFFVAARATSESGCTSCVLRVPPHFAETIKKSPLTYALTGKDLSST
jgi:hypothetical protein